MTMRYPNQRTCHFHWANRRVHSAAISSCFALSPKYNCAMLGTTALSAKTTTYIYIVYVIIMLLYFQRHKYLPCIVFNMVVSIIINNIDTGNNWSRGDGKNLQGSGFVKIDLTSSSTLVIVSAGLHASFNIPKLTRPAVSTLQW